MSSSLPATIGKYQIIREIARSNDIVYEAYDPLMDRRVALKELNLPGGTTDQQKVDRIARFERECRAAGRLAHPNIMTVYEFGQDSDRTFMAMEFLDGNTLRNEIDTKGTIPHDRTIEIAKAILSGLEHAHNNGVVHRDIKPDNIQLTTSGIKITDFGIARLTFQPNLTIDGQVFGTPSYMSPEQVRGGDIDARSDIFSVGVLMYEMFTGTKPFQGDSVITITYSILNKEPEPPQNVGFGLWRVIERAIDKSPSLRWASAKEMSQAIEEALAQQATGVIPMGSATIMPGFAAPTSNPYMTAYGTPSTPYGTPAPPPPISYPYNPYVPGPHQTGSQPQAGFPVPQNLPIYYPPPPKRPLMTPEQSATMRKVAFIIAILAAFFGTVIMAILFFTGYLGNQAAAQIRPDGQPKSAVNDAVHTEPVAYDAAQARAFADSADRDLTIAMSAFNISEREQAFDSAAKNYESAANHEPDEGLRRSYSVKAAEAYLMVYQVRRDSGRTGSDLREPVYGAVRTAPVGTELADRARQVQNELS